MHGGRSSGQTKPVAPAINRLPLLTPKWLNQQRPPPQAADQRAAQLALQRIRGQSWSRGWNRWG